MQRIRLSLAVSFALQCLSVAAFSAAPISTSSVISVMGLEASVLNRELFAVFPEVTSSDEQVSLFVSCKLQSNVATSCFALLLNPNEDLATTRPEGTLCSRAREFRSYGWRNGALSQAINRAFMSSSRMLAPPDVNFRVSCSGGVRTPAYCRISDIVASALSCAKIANQGD